MIRVASHNVMQGRLLAALTAKYERLGASAWSNSGGSESNRLSNLSVEAVAAAAAGTPHLLCLQETPRFGVAARLAASLSADHLVAAVQAPDGRAEHDTHQKRLDGQLSIVYCSRTLELVGAPRLVELRALPSLSRLEYAYSRTGRPDPKYGLHGVFRLRPRRGSPAAAAAAAAPPVAPDRLVHAYSFHLDAAGPLIHKRRQARSLSAAMARHRRAALVVAAGDTNAFSLRRRDAPRVLDFIIRPLLDRHGLADVVADFCDGDPYDEATHYFARQREPEAIKRLGVALGWLGLDLPRRTDVILANAPAEAAGRLTTRASDHDIVYAHFCV